MIETLLLWLFAGTALLAAAAMLVMRHPMRVALALVVTMLALAGVYDYARALHRHVMSLRKKIFQGVAWPKGLPGRF